MGEVYEKLPLYQLPMAEYSTISALLQVFGLRYSLASIADSLAQERKLIISAIDKLIEKIAGKCEEITLYLEGDKETCNPQSLREIARKYNIELKFLDEGSPHFDKIIELTREILPCYDPLTIDVVKCEKLEKEIAEVGRRRKEEWAERIIEEDKNCVIVLIEEQLFEKVIEKLLEKKIEYEIIPIKRSLL